MHKYTWLCSDRQMKHINLRTTTNVHKNEQMLVLSAPPSTEVHFGCIHTKSSATTKAGRVVQRSQLTCHVSL